MSEDRGTELIRSLFAHDRWANARILRAAADLDDEEFRRDLGASFGSVQRTLAHMLQVEWVWLRRCTGTSPGGPPDGWEEPDLETLTRAWAEVEREQVAFLASLTDAGLRRTVEYRNTAGQAFADPLERLLLQVVTHSTYHRGQIAGMLRRLGARPPATDLVAFFDPSRRGES